MGLAAPEGTEEAMAEEGMAEAKVAVAMAAAATEAVATAASVGTARMAAVVASAAVMVASAAVMVAAAKVPTSRRRHMDWRQGSRGCCQSCRSTHSVRTRGTRYEETSRERLDARRRFGGRQSWQEERQW